MCISRRTLTATLFKAVNSSISNLSPTIRTSSPHEPRDSQATTHRSTSNCQKSLSVHTALPVLPAPSISTMDITKFVVSGRAQTFGDNAAYRSQLSRRLLKCRQRLGITTKPRAKFQKKDDVTAEQIKANPEYAADTAPAKFPQR